MKFAYHAIDKSGRAVEDVVDAANGEDASEILRRRGLFVTEIVQGSRRAAAVQKHRGAKPGRGRRLKYVAMFSRQLHVLVATGIPLTQALEALERQVKQGAWKQVLTDVRGRVEQGTPLSEAMSGHPEYFDPICRSMIEAGETGGNLVAMLDRLAVLVRKQVHVRNSIIGAMIYPILLLTVATNVLLVMLLFVLPRFTELFTSLDAPIPPSTKALMALSAGLKAYWWAALLGIGGAVLGMRLWLRTLAGRLSRDTLFLRFPQFGQLTRNFATARIVRNLGVLLNSKVPLLDALRLVKQGTPNLLYARLLGDAEQAVTRGDPVSSAFATGGLVAPNVYEAVRNGERSGQIGPVLLNLAEFLDEENEVVMRSLTSILEPLILIVLGVVIGFIALSMFMPLFDLTSLTTGAGR